MLARLEPRDERGKKKWLGEGGVPAAAVRRPGGETGAQAPFAEATEGLHRAAHRREPFLVRVEQAP